MPFGISGAKTKIAISVFANNYFSSRKSRFAAIFREYKVLYFIINCAFQNRNFGLAHSICRIPATSAGEVARFNNMRALNYRATRAEPSIRRKIAGNSLPRFSRAEYLLAQAESHFCASALHLPIPRLSERVKRRHYSNMRALKDAVARGKPFGFPLNLTAFRKHQLAEKRVNLSHTFSTVMWSFVNTQISLAIFNAL